MRSSDAIWRILFALFPQAPESLDRFEVVLNSRPTTNPSRCSGTFETGDSALAEPYPLLLCYCRENSNDGFLKDAGAVQILLCKRPIIHAVAGEPLKMIQSLYGAFTAESVEAPKQQAIKLTFGCRCKHLLELLTVAALPAGSIHILVDHRPALSLCKSPELPELVLRVLTTVLG